MQWRDEQIIIETDTDGNYKGLLVRNIDRLLTYDRREDVRIKYEIVSASPPMESAVLNEKNDVEIAVKNMKADTFYGSTVVRAITSTGVAVDKTFYFTFRKPREK